MAKLENRSWIAFIMDLSFHQSNDSGSQKCEEFYAMMSSSNLSKQSLNDISINGPLHIWAGWKAKTFRITIRDTLIFHKLTKLFTSNMVTGLRYHQSPKKELWQSFHHESDLNRESGFKLAEIWGWLKQSNLNDESMVGFTATTPDRFLHPGAQTNLTRADPNPTGWN
jgi:hypothetical protein